MQCNALHLLLLGRPGRTRAAIPPCRLRPFDFGRAGMPFDNRHSSRREPRGPWVDTRFDDDVCLAGPSTSIEPSAFERERDERVFGCAHGTLCEPASSSSPLPPTILSPSSPPGVPSARKESGVSDLVQSMGMNEQNQRSPPNPKFSLSDSSSSPAR